MRERSIGRLTTWLYLFLVLSSVLPYVGTLGHQFTFDDHTIVVRNPATSPETSLWKTLSSPYWPPPRDAGLYRPLAILAYRTQRALWDLHPAGFHAVNILLHALSTLALLALLRRLWPGRVSLCWTAAFLFALHPIHSEAVAGIVGSAELWAALWGFTAFNLWVRCSRNPALRLLLLTWGAWLLALASKESAVGWLLLAAAHRLGVLERIPGPSSWRRLLDIGAVAIVAVFVLWRSEVVEGILGMSPPPSVDNPLVVLPIAERIVAASGLWLSGLLRIIIPTSFLPDASYAQTLPQVDASGAAGLVILAAMAALVLWRGRRGEPWVWGLAAALGTQFLTTNIPFTIGTCYAERLLYTPSFGYLFTLAALLLAAARRLGPSLGLPPRLPGWSLVFALIPAALLGAKTYSQSAIWESNEVLFRNAVEAAPRNVKARTNYAVELWHKGDLEGAESEVREALRWKPDYVPGLILSARIQDAEGSVEEALQTIKAALSIDARYADGWTFLGGVQLERRKWDEALDAYNTAHLVNPEDPEPLIGIASALAGQGRWEESVAAWERARMENPSRLEILYPYGSALAELGRDGEAVRLWREALEKGLRSPRFLNDFAWLILESGGDLREAESLSREAVRGDDSETHTDTLLRILAARGKFGAADSLLRQARERGTAPERIRSWSEVLEEARRQNREEEASRP